ncbi:MAG: hypothetical protein WBP29_08760 [Candidatus Zixiibacteriota bacterium]
MRQVLITTIAALVVCSQVLLAAQTDSLVSQFNYDRDELSFVAALTNDTNFIRDWDKPETPKLRTEDTYRRGDYVYPLIILSTTINDKSGNPNLTYDISVTKPDGSIYGEYKKLRLWQDYPAPLTHLIQQPLIIRLEPVDPLGTYKVKMIVHENVREREIPFELSFRVVDESEPIAESKEYEFLPPGGVGFVLNNYYKNPDVQMLPMLMIEIDNSGMLAKESARGPIEGFFAVALAATTIDSLSIQKVIESLGSSKEFFRHCFTLRHYKDTVLNVSSHHPGVNDMMWGGFFASGDLRYVERLISELQFCDNQDSVYLYLTGATAKWSLGSNSRQHPKVKTYLEEMVGKVTPAIAFHLREALKSDSAVLEKQMMDKLKKFKKS